MRRILAALLASALVALLAVWLTAPAGFSEALPAPAPGQVQAARLRDGSPVFVVRDDAGEARVFSAVSTHLSNVVAWCPDPEPGVFIEPAGATRFDRRGGWLPGPAPTGLAPYEARLSEDGRSVLVGRLGDPVPRWMPGEVPPREWGACEESEGSVGGVFPPGTAPAEAISVGELPRAPIGRFVAVDGTIDFSRRPALLCPRGTVSRCEDGGVQVRGFFWDHLLDRVLDRPYPGFAASVTGPLLVRRVGAGVVDRVAVLMRLVEAHPVYRYSVTWVRDDPPQAVLGATYVGLLERVTISGDDVVLHGDFTAVPDPDEPPPEMPATLDRVTLRRRLGMVLDRGRDAPVNAFSSPEDLARRLAEGGEPIPVRFGYALGARLWSVSVFDTLPVAQSGP